MSISLWLAFVAASSVLLAIPGPTILTVISYSMAHGRRANLPLIAAVGLGDATALTASILGLGALLATSAFWFTVVKFAGGLYLVYLGIRTLFAKIPSEEVAAPVIKSQRKLFLNTYLATASNPKGIVFFVVFLPQFVRPDSAVGEQLWILAITFVALAIVNAALYALFARSARGLFASSATRTRFNAGGGTLLLLGGLWTLLEKRPA
ncbi:LysE family translocator [Salinisphaera sp. LB1]|uniref:LysE family translocator n=1 Tax=Salinisphaera sp. LB1 TaxID=2183911 RepID=UPI000D7060A5|nr:LysE family translocator [Salinisphaera sp. LB1]